MDTQKQFMKLAHVVSSIGITFLSANAVFLELADQPYWISSNIVDSIFRFCIPVFFMMPGISLLEMIDIQDLKPYFKSRFWMSVVPYAAWSLIGMLFNVFYLKSVPASNMNAVFITNGLLNGSLFSIFWFFIPLFGIELSMPLFAAVSEEKRIKVFSYLFFTGVLVNLVIPFVIEVFHLPIYFPIQVLAIAGYMIYIPASYMVAKYPFSKRQRYLVYVLGLLSLFAMIYMTQILSLDEGAINLTYKGYLSLPTFVYSFAVFLLLKNIAPKVMGNPGVSRVITFMRGYTFCFYLEHKFLFDFLTRTFHFNVYSAWYRFGMPFLAFPVVVLFTWVLRKIPGVKRIVP